MYTPAMKVSNSGGLEAHLCRLVLSGNFICILLIFTDIISWICHQLLLSWNGIHTVELTGSVICEGNIANNDSFIQKRQQATTWTNYSVLCQASAGKSLQCAKPKAKKTTTKKQKTQ